ncbi:MAG: hypothetical protein KJ070_23165 [Verrucomicrobia bacterium]|nr:hypothetical protein [Verrucomicrobiota bacterium]
MPTHCRRHLCAAFALAGALTTLAAPEGKMHFPGRKWSVVKPEAEALDSSKL